MKQIISIIFIALCSLYSLSQTQGIDYRSVGRGVATTFVNDYHSLGVNSSTLGWGNEYGKRFTTGMTEFSLGIYSDSLNVERLKKLYKAVRSDISGKDQDPASWAEQKQFAQDYMRAGIIMDASYNWLGFSFQNEKFGGIAFSINEQYNWYSKLNEETTDLIFGGKLSDYFDSLTIVFGTDTSQIYNTGNISEDTLDNVILGTISVPLLLSDITNGSSIRFTWNRNYNFGYGRKIFGSDSTFALYGGIGGRFIQSMAMLTLESDGDNVYMYSALSPSYDIDYGSVASINPSNFTEKSFIPKPVGTGFGLDFSVSAKFFGKLKVAAAVNNIGSVTYKRNVYTVLDSIVGEMSLNGLSNYNMTNSLDQLLADGGLLRLVGKEQFTVQNAANFRLGASIDFGKIASFGVDFVGPFDNTNPGSLANGVISIGGDIKPVKWLCLSAGYLGGGIYKHNIPVGINFILGGGTYEFGISSRDMLSFFLDDSNSVSTAFGFARVRF